VSGVALVVRKVQRYRDRKRYSAYVVWREELRRQQRAAQQELATRHDLQTADIQRRLRALDQVEQRERDSAQQAARRERRQRINARHAHMPSIAPVLNSWKQEPAPPPEANRGQDAAIVRALAEAAQLLKEARTPIRLTEGSVKASDDDESGEGAGDTGAVLPVQKREQKKRVRRRSKVRCDFRQAASGEQGEGEAGGESSEAPKPATEAPSAEKRRRRRKRKPRDGPVAGDRRHDQDQDDKAIQDDAQKKERQRRRRRRDFKPGS
jgi:hypothetical protein